MYRLNCIYDGSQEWWYIEKKGWFLWRTVSGGFNDYATAYACLERISKRYDVNGKVLSGS